METVGIRELKAHLSEYLRRVRAGERLAVTDHGRVIATVASAGEPTRLDWVHKMVAEGRATWSGGKPTFPARGIPSRGKLASRMVLEDRR